METTSGKAAVDLPVQANFMKYGFVTRQSKGFDFPTVRYFSACHRPTLVGWPGVGPGQAGRAGSDHQFLI